MLEILFLPFKIVLFLVKIALCIFACGLLLLLLPLALLACFAIVVKWIL